MLIQIVFLAFAATLAQATNSEESSSSDVEPVESPSRRCGASLMSNDRVVENPFGAVAKAASSVAVPDPYYQRLVELDHIYPVGYHYGCSIGIPTMYGCAVQMINGKFLIVGPLLEDHQPRVKPLEVESFHPLGVNSLCSVGIPSIFGCMVQEINGMWLRVERP